MRKLNKGMTLTELMAAVAILGIIIVPVSTVFNVGYQTYYIEDDTSAAQHQVREAMTQILDDLRKYDYDNAGYDDSPPDLNYIVDSTPPGNPVTAFSIVDSGGSTISYNWSDLNDTLSRNALSGAKTWDSIVNFSIEEEDVGTERVINILIKAKYLKGREIELKNSYRRKALSKEE